MAKALMRELPAEVVDLIGPAYRSLPSTGTAILRYAKRSLSETPTEVPPITLGMLSRMQNTEIRGLTQVELKNADFMLDANAIRHINAKHGTDETERPRGQRAVTLADYARLAQLLNAPDDVFLESMEGNAPVIRYVKAFDDGILHALFVVLRGRNRVGLKTLFVRLTADPPRVTP